LAQVPEVQCQWGVHKGGMKGGCILQFGALHHSLFYVFFIGYICPVACSIFTCTIKMLPPFNFPLIYFIFLLCSFDVPPSIGSYICSPWINFVCQPMPLPRCEGNSTGGALHFLLCCSTSHTSLLALSQNTERSWSFLLGLAVPS